LQAAARFSEPLRRLAQGPSHAKMTVRVYRFGSQRHACAFARREINRIRRMTLRRFCLCGRWLTMFVTGLKLLAKKDEFQKILQKTGKNRSEIILTSFKFIYLCAVPRVLFGVRNVLIRL
jgi:hypothetical protein